MVNLTFDYVGRTIVVTGAARGVGRAIAERFRQAGGTVICVDADEDAVTDTAKEIGATGWPPTSRTPRPSKHCWTGWSRTRAGWTWW